VSSPKRRRIAEALAIAGAAALVAGSFAFGGAGESAQVDRASAPGEAVSGVVLVDSDDAARVTSSWRAVPSASLPGDVLVASTASQCPAVVTPRAKADQAVERQASCSGAIATSEQRHLALQDAAASARDADAELVLVGAGWTSTPPVPVADVNDPEALGLAIFGAAATGTLPDLSGLTVVVVDRSTSEGMKAAWQAYLAAAGAEKVEWISR